MSTQFCAAFFVPSFVNVNTNLAGGDAEEEGRSRGAQEQSSGRGRGASCLK